MKKIKKILYYLFSFFLFQSVLWVTIFDTSFINDNRYFAKEAWKWSETINQPYFNIQGEPEVFSSFKDAYPIAHFDFFGVDGCRELYRNHYYASEVTNKLKIETALVEGNYPSNDNEILVTKRFKIRDPRETRPATGRKITYKDHDYYISGVLDTHIRYELFHFDKATEYDPKVNNLDHSFIFTENEFNHLFKPSSLVVKINSEKHLLALKKRKDIDVDYSVAVPTQYSQFAGFHSNLPRFLKIISMVLSVAYLFTLFVFITKNIEKAITFNLKEAAIYSVIFFVLDFILLLILDIVGKKISNASTFYFSLGITSMIILAFLILNLFIMYLPNRISSIKEKKKAKFYHYDLRHPEK